MSDVWRIFVIEGEEALNHNIVNSLRKDGYIVQGVMSGTEAVRILWSEEHDVVLCDLKTPGADGFELLQWLRASRPNTRMLLVGAAGSSTLRMKALEAGAAGYLEKPLDLHILKEELRRLLQQTGFSANLDSFDLLDVIQIITMSRKSIALLVNTGLEERGLLCFKNGDLVWAEYGVLRGEEAFFALAAHKNGTVTQQPWGEQVASNVTQPLSRLIFQALQYRTKYADQQPYSGEQAALVGKPSLNREAQPVVENSAFMVGGEDDTPFGVLDDSFPFDIPGGSAEIPQVATLAEKPVNKEWWERTGAMTRLNSVDNIDLSNVSLPADIDVAPTMAIDGRLIGDGGEDSISDAVVGKPSVNLPSWLTEQPTATNLPAVRPSPTPVFNQTPTGETIAPVWQPMPPVNGSGALTPKQSTGVQGPVTGPPLQSTGAQRAIAGMPQAFVADTGVHRATEWQMPEPISASLPRPGVDEREPPLRGTSGGLALSDSGERNNGMTGASRAIKSSYNYPALVSALQTFGYSIAGFIAAAVVDMEGEVIAHVTMSDMDIARICRHFGNVLKGTQQLLEQGLWGDYEDTVITSADRYIVMRVIRSEKTIFQVVVTRREAKPADSLEVMTNVEGAISAALHSDGD